MRVSFKQIQEGKTPHSSTRSIVVITFEERLAELATFKVKHGHCNNPNIPSIKSKHLGTWELLQADTRRR